MDPQHHAELGEAGRVREPQPEVGQRHADRSDGGMPWLTSIGFGCYTFNSGMAVYRSNGDFGSMAFVAFSYFDLVLLFICLRYYDRGAGAPSSPRRNRVKAAVWALTTLLTVLFSIKIAAVMPLSVAMLVWAMAATTVVGGFYAFFVHQDRSREPQP